MWRYLFGIYSQEFSTYRYCDKVNVLTYLNFQMQTETSAGSGLYAILDFLDMLCARSENGRVLVIKGEQSGQLKYLLLNPAEQFTDVVKQCRSVS